MIIFLSIEEGVFPDGWVIFSALFVAPYMETFLFQKIGFHIMDKIKIYTIFKIIFISVIFSFCHFERDFEEKVELFFVGIIFTGVYYFYKINLNEDAFKITAGAHFIYNLIIII